MPQLIYKIIHVDEWQMAESAGEFAGAGIDLADGFIHFSAASQVQETADRHFANQTDLLLVAVEAGLLGDNLRWEESRGGEPFPHLYGKLSMDQVSSVNPIRRNKNGRNLIDIGV